MDSPKLKRIRILVLEDAPLEAERRRIAILREFARRGGTPGSELEGIEPKIIEVDHGNALGVALKGDHFHYLILDLRVPDEPGGDLTTEPVGLSKYVEFLDANAFSPYRPYCAGSVLTQYSSVHAGAANRAGDVSLEFWQKAAGDSGPGADAPRLGDEDVARFVVDRVVPYSVATYEALTQLSPDMPRHLARLCDALSAVCVSKKALIANPAAAALHARDRRAQDREALLDACRLGERCKEWMFTIVAAHLSLHAALPAGVRELAQTTNLSGIESQKLKEDLLEQMLLALISLFNDRGPSLGFDYTRFFSHLDLVTEAKNIGIEFVRGLRELRQVRNDLSHKSMEPPFDAQWKRIAIPLQRVLDAMAMLGSFALVTQVRQPAPGFIQAQRFDAVSTRADTVGVERVGMADARSRSIHIDPRQVHMLWPASGGGLGLVPLWPWVARVPQANDSRLATYFYAGRNDKGHVLGLEAEGWEARTFRDGDVAMAWHDALAKVAA